MNGNRVIEWLIKNGRFLFWHLGLKNNLNETSIKGEYGEWLARRYLRKKGYFLLEKNWRSKKNNRLEIDLIFKDCEILVFVEVRARSSKGLVSGYDSINHKKRNSLRRAFNAYLRETSNTVMNYRFDVVEIDLPYLKSLSSGILHHQNIAIF